MKYLIALLALAVMFACDVPSPIQQTTVNVGQTQGGVSDPDEPTVPKGPGAPSHIMRLEPASVTMDVGNNAHVRVVVSTLSGNEVPTELLQVFIEDGSVAAVTEIDGRIMTLRGLSAGATVATVSANGLSSTLVIIVE